MRDRKLTTLVFVLIVLILGHDADHFFRGEIQWQPTPGGILLFVIFLAKYAALGLALFYYFENKIGPLFWAIVAGIGLALGWLAHFSPFTEQTPQYIYRAYETPAAGALAVAWLAALMLALIVTAIYAEYLWARGLQ